MRLKFTAICPFKLKITIRHLTQTHLINCCLWFFLSARFFNFLFRSRQLRAISGFRRHCCCLRHISFIAGIADKHEIQINVLLDYVYFT